MRERERDGLGGAARPWSEQILTPAQPHAPPPEFGVASEAGSGFLFFLCARRLGSAPEAGSVPASAFFCLPGMLSCSGVERVDVAADAVLEAHVLMPL